MSMNCNNALIMFVEVSSLQNIIFQIPDIKIMSVIQDLINQTIQQRNDLNIIETGQSLLLNWKTKQNNTNNSNNTIFSELLEYLSSAPLLYFILLANIVIYSVWS